MESYDTLTEGLQQLRCQGYTAGFNLRPVCLYCVYADLLTAAMEAKLQLAPR